MYKKEVCSALTADFQNSNLFSETLDSRAPWFHPVHFTGMV